MISLRDSLKKSNVLYIHGLGSSKDSTTFKILSQEFKDEYNWYTDTFDLMHPTRAIRQINNIIRNRNISIIVSSSFGAFYALCVEDSLARIVINPCMEPAYEIPKLTNDSLDIKKIETLTANVYHNIDAEMRMCTFGIFGNQDELFSYKNKYKELYGNNFITINGHHRLEKAALVGSVKRGFEYFKNLTVKLNKIDESIICEKFVNIFTKEDTSNKLSKYQNEVYGILQKAYEPIGGLLGCDNAKMLIDDTDFWKLCIKEGRVVAVFVYTFKRGGRKLVYCGTDGTPLGKEWFYKIINDDINFRDRQAWAEVSGAMEHIYLKRGAIPVPADVAKEIMKDKEFVKIHDDNLHYDRQIGGEDHTKIMVGFPKKS